MSKHDIQISDYMVEEQDRPETMRRLTDAEFHDVQAGLSPFVPVGWHQHTYNDEIAVRHEHDDFVDHHKHDLDDLKREIMAGGAQIIDLTSVVS